MFGLLFASFETISSTLTLAIMLINENPKVIRELTVSDTKSSKILHNIDLEEAFLVFKC